jgi:hypothetical protein
MTRTITSAALAFTALLLAVPGAQAASCAGGTIDYVGPVNGAWNAAGNWSPASLPSATDVVCIPAGKGSIDVPAATTADAKLVKAQSGITIEATATLALSDSAGADVSALSDLTLPAGATLSTAGSSITIAGNALVDGLISRNPLISDSLKLLSGTLSGTGEIALPFNNLGGIVQPGGAGVVGTLVFDSLYSQQLGTTLVLDLASDASFDKLAVASNNAFFAGNIQASLLGAYNPAVGTVWRFIPTTPGASFFDVVTPIPSSFTAQTVPNGATITLSSALPVVVPPPVSPVVPIVGPVSPISAPVAPPAPRVDPVVLGCSNRKLVLNDVVIHNGRVALDGAAAGDLIGQTVTITFNGATRVATATVGPDGRFSTTAPLPPARLRSSNSARYTASAAGLKSLDLKLTRRLVLASPATAGGKVTLTGQVVAPLASPRAMITVSQQIDCGRTSVVKRFKPGPTGRFTISLPAPAGASGAIYRLTTSVPRSATTHTASPTFSLPLPAVFRLSVT